MLVHVYSTNTQITLAPYTQKENEPRRVLMIGGLDSDDSDQVRRKEA